MAVFTRLVDFKRQDQIHAAEADDWAPWRVDADGTQWYARIKGFEALPAIHAGASDDDDEDDAEDTLSELRAELAHEAALSHERAMKRYHRLLESRSRGVDIPDDLGREVLAACGKTMADWNADLAELHRLDAEIAALGSEGGK